MKKRGRETEIYLHALLERRQLSDGVSAATVREYIDGCIGSIISHNLTPVSCMMSQTTTLQMGADDEQT